MVTKPDAPQVQRLAKTVQKGSWVGRVLGRSRNSISSSKAKMGMSTRAEYLERTAMPTRSPDRKECHPWVERVAFRKANRAASTKKATWISEMAIPEKARRFGSKAQSDKAAMERTEGPRRVARKSKNPIP